MTILYGTYYFQSAILLPLLNSTELYPVFNSWQENFHGALGTDAGDLHGGVAHKSRLYPGFWSGTYARIRSRSRGSLWPQRGTNHYGSGGGEKNPLFLYWTRPQEACIERRGRSIIRTNAPPKKNFPQTPPAHTQHLVTSSCG